MLLLRPRPVTLAATVLLAVAAGPAPASPSGTPRGPDVHSAGWGALTIVAENPTAVPVRASFCRTRTSSVKGRASGPWTRSSCETRTFAPHATLHFGIGRWRTPAFEPWGPLEVEVLPFAADAPVPKPPRGERTCGEVRRGSPPRTSALTTLDVSCATAKTVFRTWSAAPGERTTPRGYRCERATDHAPRASGSRAVICTKDGGVISWIRR